LGRRGTRGWPDQYAGADAEISPVEAPADNELNHADISAGNLIPHAADAQVPASRRVPGIVAVRDSKNPDGGILRLSREEWQVFVAEMHGGRHA
jgi:hypothetical protein